MGSNVTLEMVADLAEVSTCTVSKILSGRDANSIYKRETIARVKAAAKRLQYFPRIQARGLRSGLKYMMTFVTSNVGENHTREYLAPICVGAMEKLAQKGYSVQTLVAESAEKASALFGQSDGIAAITELSDEIRDLIEAKKLPAIWVNMGKGKPHDCIEPDDVSGCKLLARHLLDCGYENAFFVRRNDMERPHRSLITRRNVMKENLTGFHFEEVLRETAPLGDIYRRVRKGQLKKTVIAGYGEGDTTFALCLALSHGLSVPGDIGFCACDMTVVREDIYGGVEFTGAISDIFEVGHQSGRMLLEKIEHNGFPIPSVCVPESLVIGNSTRQQ